MKAIICIVDEPVVVLGRLYKMPSPGSITFGQELWVAGPGHPISGFFGMGTLTWAHRYQPMRGGAQERRVAINCGPIHEIKHIMI